MGLPIDPELLSQACRLPALRHPRGQHTDAARALVFRIPRVRHHHGCQRHGARRLRLDHGYPGEHSNTLGPPLKHLLINLARNSSTPQICETPKPRNFNVLISNVEAVSIELRAEFWRLHPLWSITPDQWALHPIRTGAMLTDRVHALIDDKLYCGCASYAEWTPRLNRLFRVECG